jgi:DICT domain-containing protein
MTIIQQLIQKEYQTDEKLSNIIRQGLAMREVDLYLNCLDKLAILNAKTHITMNDQMLINKLEQRREILITKIKEHIYNMISNKDIAHYAAKAEQIQYLIADNIDFAQTDREYSKLYIIIKIIADMPMQQQKNSIQL